MVLKIEQNIKIFHMNLNFQCRCNKITSALMHAMVKDSVHKGVVHVIANILMMTVQLKFKFTKKVKPKWIYLKMNSSFSMFNQTFQLISTLNLKMVHHFSI